MFRRLIVLALGALATWASAAATLAEAIADLPPAAQAKVQASVRSFVAAKLDADRSANNLAWDCLAVARMVELGVAGARERLEAVAGELLADAVRSRKTGRPIGWSTIADRQVTCVPVRAGTPTARGCEGDATVYAFQSGLGVACLSRAGALLPRAAFLDTGRAVMAYWIVLQQPDSPCRDCIYFATSDSAADGERYVRNMNLFMAFGAGELGRATDDQALLQAARQALRSDVVERKAGNKGYLGRLDPIWSTRPGETDRIENHSASMALLLADMTRAIGGHDAQQQAETVYADWAHCVNERCRNAGCRYWAGDARRCQGTATAAHCAFRRLDDRARTQCETFVERVPRLSGYALWSLLMDPAP
jgi:hypothetical protein